MSSESTASDLDRPTSVDADVQETHLLNQLADVLATQQATFCCGGRIVVTENDNRWESLTVDNRPATSPPVVLRWDLPSGKGIRKLTLPPIAEAEDTTAIKELLRDCALASFGLNGKEVRDESYRKAVKLDNHQCSTNFSPHDLGVIDAVAQSLLPGIAKPFLSESEDTFVEHFGVVAELYTLNVSGAACFSKFRPLEALAISFLLTSCSPSYL